MFQVFIIDPMIKFMCQVDTKENYYEVKRRILFQKGTLTREHVRDLKNDFFAEFECLVHGRTLYLDLKESGICKNIALIPSPS